MAEEEVEKLEAWLSSFRLAFGMCERAAVALATDAPSEDAVCAILSLSRPAFDEVSAPQQRLQGFRDRVRDVVAASSGHRVA